MSFTQPTRRLISQEDAAHIENPNIPRSKFVNQWSRKTSFDAAFLVPILVDELLPGDHMTYNVTAYVRMSTPLFPIFDTQRIDTFWFFVPCRLLWDNWKKFMGEQQNPTDSIAFTIPQIDPSMPAAAANDLWDHFGLPMAPQLTANISVNALPFRAYNQIWNQWFRDENLVTAAPRDVGDGPDPLNHYGLLRRAKSHDYFTSALPWPQKFTAPTVPLGTSAPVRGIGLNGPGDTGVNIPFYETGGAQRYYSRSTISGQPTVPPSPAGNTYIGVDSNAGIPVIYADLSQATGIAINTLRQAFLVQQLLERDARGGTRYVEKIRSHFGVISPDFRLARPEYIGGGSSPLNITPIAQTAPTVGLTVGALGAAGTSGGTHHASYAATEHGYIIGLINVRTELSYQQGIPKLWSRLTQYDFYIPSLAGLGEQAILEKELYATGVAVDDNIVFGYQERWQEYRTRYSDVTGIMRSTATGTLDSWHLAQKFVTPQTLGPVFIQEDPPMARVLAAGAQAARQQYLADILFQRVAVRPIPTFGTPVTLGRF